MKLAHLLLALANKAIAANCAVNNTDFIMMVESCMRAMLGSALLYKVCYIQDDHAALGLRGYNTSCESRGYTLSAESHKTTVSCSHAIGNGR